MDATTNASPVAVLGPPTIGAETKVSWGDAAQFSASQTADAPTPTLAVPDAPKSDLPAELVQQRLHDVLAAIGQPADIDLILVEVNANTTLREHIARGLAEAALAEMDNVVKTDEGTPLRTHYAIAEAKPVVTFSLEREARARAALVSALVARLVYPVGGVDAGSPEAPRDGGVDSFQIAYICHVSRTRGDQAPIFVPMEYVEALGGDLDPKDVDGLEARVVGRLQELVASGMVESREVEIGASIKVGDAAAEDAAEAESSDAIGKVTIYALSEAGGRKFLAGGASGVATSTLPPIGPSIDELIETAIAPVRVELANRTREMEAAISQRNRALEAEAAKGKEIEFFRGWFSHHGLENPELLSSQRPKAKKMVSHKLAIDLNIDQEQHWRIVAEWEAAKTARTELGAASDTSKETWKGKLKAADELVVKLEGMMSWRGRHVIDKDVWKEIQHGELVTFSAEEHDYGTVILREPINNLASGTQTVIPQSVPLQVMQAAAAKAGESIAAAHGGKFAVGPGGVVSITIDPDKKGTIIDRVFAFLSKSKAAEEDICKALDIEHVALAGALATLGARVQKDGSLWHAVVEESAPEPEVVKPKAGEDSDLSVPTIRKNLKALFRLPDVLKTGLLRGQIGPVYARFVGVNPSDGVARMVDVAVNLELQANSLAQGNAGEDMIVWAADQPDPRLSNADRAAEKSASSVKVSVTKPDDAGEEDEEEGEEDEGEEEDDDAEDASEEEGDEDGDGERESEAAPAKTAAKAATKTPKPRAKRAKAAAAPTPAPKKKGARGGKAKAGA